MPDDDDRRLFLARSLKYLQENIRRSGPAAAAGYTLIGAIILLGGIGYAIDQWQGTSQGATLAILVGDPATRRAAAAGEWTLWVINPG